MSDEIPDPPGDRYASDEIILYGVRLDGATTFKISLPFKNNKKRAFLEFAIKRRKDDDSGDEDAKDHIATIVAYGYAFEGACYRFDRPRVLIIEPERVGGKVDGEPAKGCGFGGVGGYKMWRISKGESVVDMTIGMGPAEEIVLEPNRPGNRAPNTYGNKLAVGHRGKQLTGM